MNSMLRNLTVFISSVCLIACGFHLRGANQFEYKSIFISGNTQINKPLIKALATNNIQVVSEPSQAELQLELLKEESEKRILSLSGDGVVREYELYYRVHYRTKPTSEPLWSQPQTMEARRDFSYSDANLLAKQGEEKRLNENMRSDVLNGLMRRLAALKK
jgi:LPS-assembly lipoprotein